MKFTKYHALGNDYLVLDPADWPEMPAPEQIRRICHRNYGVGGDGILFGPAKAPGFDFSLRIFNPDGSEAEKSGNGLSFVGRVEQRETRQNFHRAKLMRKRNA